MFLDQIPENSEGLKAHLTVIFSGPGEEVQRLENFEVTKHESKEFLRHEFYQIGQFKRR